jgi:hypothetical protein
LLINLVQIQKKSPAELENPSSPPMVSPLSACHPSSHLAIMLRIMRVMIKVVIMILNIEKNISMMMMMVMMMMLMTLEMVGYLLEIIEVFNYLPSSKQLNDQNVILSAALETRMKFAPAVDQSTT